MSTGSFLHPVITALALLRPTPLRGSDTLAQITQPRETRTKTCYHSAIRFIVNATIT